MFGDFFEILVYFEREVKCPGAQGKAVPLKESYFPQLIRSQRLLTKIQL